jgi:predicted molibdopterin-dependent oxidoreductase YjgC
MSAESALKNARFVVVQDVSNRADTVHFADVVLPAAAWLEKEGTMTNAERRITYFPKCHRRTRRSIARFRDPLAICTENGFWKIV